MSPSLPWCCCAFCITYGLNYIAFKSADSDFNALLESLIEQSHEFIGGQTGLPDDTPYNRFWQVESLVIWYSDSA